MLKLSVILNALALFVPAMIGVIGSYLIYERKQKKRLENLREAFLAELENTEYLSQWPSEDGDAPINNFLSRAVYEANSGDIGLLSREEVNSIVQYYTQAQSLQDYLRIHSDIIARSEASFLGDDFNEDDRSDSIRNAIDRLELSRIRAVLTIKKARTQSKLPKSGEFVKNQPEIVQADLPLLIDYGLVEKPVQGKAKINQKGEDFFSGNVSLVGTSKVRDVLERERGTPYSVFRKIWVWIGDLAESLGSK